MLLSAEEAGPETQRLPSGIPELSGKGGAHALRAIISVLLCLRNDFQVSLYKEKTVTLPL